MIPLAYKVFDVETTIHEKFKRKANPFLPENWIVMRGWKNQGDSRGQYSYYPTHNRKSYLHIEPHITLLVGSNIKFDLLWEMEQGNPDLHAFFKRGGEVWDCQYAEYLLHGHVDEVQFASLDDMSTKYGGRTKIDEVKILWEQGVQTNEINEDLLVDYLLGTHEENRNSGDIGNTEIVFLAQVKKAAQLGMIKVIQDRMDGLLCTTEMEFRGLHVDVQEAGRRLKVLTADLKEADNELQKFIPADLPFEFNWGSPIQKSCLIFGGTVKYKDRRTYLDPSTGELARYKATVDWPMVSGNAMSPEALASGGWEQDRFISGARKGELKFKKVDVPGELKIKWQDYVHELEGYTEPDPSWKLKTLDGSGAPTYSTGGDTIDAIALRGVPFCKALGRKSFLDKEIGTYYVKIDKNGVPSGMLTCVQPWDHMLHHKLNHTATITSRLSSSDPNLQNLTRVDMDKDGKAKSEIKKMFISRFPNGEMIEIDYSQLEVVVQGVLSKDKQLCEDLRSKIDFHCKRVSAKHHITYQEAVAWCKQGVSFPALEAKGLVGKSERTKVKEFSFQRAYGAGATAIALATGMEKEEVEALIEAEERMYPGIVAFNSEVEKQVIQSATPYGAIDIDTGEWKMYRRGTYIGPTGTRYVFRTWNAPEFMRKRGTTQTFSPPELKNYPVQGTGGEFVICILGRLWRHFVSVDFYDWSAFLVNTVHDCVWADTKPEVRKQVATDMRRIMQSIPEYYNKRYGLGIDVPFPVDVEYGLNMMDLHHMEFNDNGMPKEEAA